MAAPLASLAPSEEFFQGLEKYFANDLEGAKKALTGDDLFSKSLLTLVDVKADDGSKNDEIQARIDAMDFQGNDIALMFCVLAQEYGMHMTKAHNILLKRFGKEEKVIGTEPEEMPELEEVNNGKSAPLPKAEAEAEPEAEPNAKPEAKPEAAPEAEAKPEATPKVNAEVKQAGGKRKTRKLTSSPPKKRRVSRGKA